MTNNRAPVHADRVAAHDPGGRSSFPLPEHVQSSAVFSPCGQYRYRLERRWDGACEEDPFLLWIMMNPSTATERLDDPTVRKCRAYAALWGFRRMVVANVMAYRCTSPKGLLCVPDPVGLDNPAHLRDLLASAGQVIAAWGSLHRTQLGHAAMVRGMAAEAGIPLQVLRLSKTGMPWHPLYVPMSVLPTEWNSL